MKIIVNYNKNAFLFWFGLFLFAVNVMAKPCAEGFTYHQTRFSGLAHTASSVVQRELQHPVPGQFSPHLWMAEKRRLESLDLFAQIQVECSGDTLHYEFTELFQFFPAPAGKKTDQDGWMLGLALAHLNVGGQDVRLEGQFRTSLSPWMDAKEYALYASSPWLAHWPLDWNVELVRTDSWDPLRGFLDQSWALWGDFRYPIWHRVSALFNTGGRRLDHAPWVPGLGAGLLWDSRDSRLDARRGLYSEARVSHFGGPLGGRDDFSEFLYDGRLYFTQTQHVLGLSALVRWRPGTQHFYERLHQGGANTLRGYDTDSSWHGRHESLFNAEYRRIVVERQTFHWFGIDGFWGLQAVAGVDGAFLWNQTTPDWAHYRSAVYAGLHAIIPALDRIRCEIGYSHQNRDWVIAVGLFEKNVTQRWRTR